MLGSMKSERPNGRAPTISSDATLPRASSTPRGLSSTSRATIIVWWFRSISVRASFGSSGSGLTEPMTGLARRRLTMAPELKPIRTGADYEAALAEVERPWGAENRIRERDRLDVLATLIDAYEAAHYSMDPPDPIEAIRVRTEQQGISRKDLEPLIGSRARCGGIESQTRAVHRDDSKAARKTWNFGRGADSPHPAWRGRVKAPSRPRGRPRRPVAGDPICNLDFGCGDRI